jgi:addiction module RelE/StbE family toxin
MKIKKIILDDEFLEEFDQLPHAIQKRVLKTKQLLLENPLYPSLRLHKLSGHLQGLWSIRINRHYRIIFEPLEGGNVLFVSVGTHAIYD